MDSLGSLLEKKIARPAARKNIHSKEHDLAESMTVQFGEPKKFGMYLGIIKRLGFGRALALFKYVQESNARRPAALFMSLCKKKSSEETGTTPSSTTAKEL